MKERSLRMERGDRKRGVERIEEEKMAFKEEVRIQHKVMGSAKISHSCGSPRQRACFFENWLQKRIRTRFAQGLHSCDFRTEILGGTESMFFENWPQKRIRTRGCVVRKFRTRGMGGANFAVSWLFSPIFPCFHSSSFPTYMLTQKPIKTTLE